MAGVYGGSPYSIVEELPYRYPCENGSGMALDVAAGSIVFFIPRGSKNRSSKAVAIGLPSSFSTIRPSST